MFVLLGCAFVLSAQQVTFQLSKLPAENDSIYLAGNINGWNPANTQFKFDKQGKLIVQAKTGDVIEFKCAKGSWGKVEVTADGSGIGNRVLKVNSDTIVYITIGSWSHLFENKGKQHTASVNVSIFDTAFLFPSLGYTKAVRIYLPPNYQQSNKKFPVLYMQDGQNVFDEFTSGYGEWHVDEAMDSLYKTSGISFIVVGIDHGNEKRINEYNPYDSTRYGRGVGELYLKDLAEVLKPAIDKTYRTSTASRNTWIAGSSMGGLISTYGVFNYPKVFGGAGVFSPAYWINTSIESAAMNYSIQSNKKNKFYFYAGGNEGEQMVPDMEKIAAIICNGKQENCTSSVDAEAKHNEAAWTKHFHEFLKFMLANSSSR